LTVKILALKRYAAKGGTAENLQEARLEVGQGIEGNLLKHPERQVCILTKEAEFWLEQQEERGLCLEKLKENILLDGVIERGGKLTFGDAVLQVGIKKKHCFETCVHRVENTLCPLSEGVLFANVLQGGTVSQGEVGYFVAPRYTRNMQALSGQEVAALHTKKVCVIGAGGLGGYIVAMLARIGVLHITLVDYDVFEASNLNRQLFSRESFLGMPKVEAAVQYIAEVNSAVRLIGIQEKFSEDNADDLLRGHDVVVDALDSIKTRFLLVRTCRELNIPLVHGSIAGWFGQVCSILPGDDTLEKLYRNAKEERGGEVRLGNLPFTAAAVASFQCAECVKLLLGREDLIRNAVLQVDLLDGDCHRIAL